MPHVTENAIRMYRSIELPFASVGGPGRPNSFSPTTDLSTIQSLQEHKETYTCFQLRITTATLSRSQSTAASRLHTFRVHGIHQERGSRRRPSWAMAGTQWKNQAMPQRLNQWRL